MRILVRLNLTHTTVYNFARPVAFNPHRLVLRPRSGGDLQVLSCALDITPTAQLAWSTDVFGNHIATARFEALAERLEITSRLVVDETASDWPVFPIAPSAQQYPFRHSLDEAIDLGALRASDGDSSVAAWARGFVAARERTRCPCSRRSMRVWGRSSPMFRAQRRARNPPG